MVARDVRFGRKLTFPNTRQNRSCAIEITTATDPRFEVMSELYNNLINSTLVTMNRQILFAE